MRRASDARGLAMLDEAISRLENLIEDHDRIHSARHFNRMLHVVGDQQRLDGQASRDDVVQLRPSTVCSGVVRIPETLTLNTNVQPLDVPMQGCVGSTSEDT